MVDVGSTLDELHDVLQVAFAWSGDHLHRFKIHGREYDTGAPVALGDPPVAADRALRAPDAQPVPGWPRPEAAWGVKVSVQVVIESQDGTPTVVRDVFSLERGALAPDTVGLHLDEAKDLLETGGRRGHLS